MVLIFFLSGLFQPSFSQQVSPDFNALVAPFNSQKKSKVMILGTFHFNDGGHDAFKPRFTVDIRSVKRQTEVGELVALLAKFKPTKVAIESMPQRQKFHDSLYTEFINKRYAPGENETYQVSYRLAALMRHKKVYNIDAPPGRFSDGIGRRKFRPDTYLVL